MIEHVDGSRDSDKFISFNFKLTVKTFIAVYN